RLNGAEDAVRRDRRRVAGPAGQPADVIRFHVDVVHVGRTRADVLRRDVAAAEALDEAPMRAEDHFAKRRFVVADDDRLTAAEIQTGDGVLVGHATRETQRVDDRLFVRAVAPEARSAERGTEDGAMNGDDAAVSRRRILAE